MASALDQPLLKPVELDSVLGKKTLRVGRSATLREAIGALFPDMFFFEIAVEGKERAGQGSLEQCQQQAMDETKRLIALLDRRGQGEKLEADDAEFLDAYVLPLLDRSIEAHTGLLRVVKNKSEDIEDAAREDIVTDQQPGFIAEHIKDDAWAIEAAKQDVDLTPDDVEDTQAALVAGKIHQQNLIRFFNTVRKAVTPQIELQ